MAIEVSGCHLVLVICGHGSRNVHQPQDLGHVATAKVIPGAPPGTVAGPDSRGQPANHRDQATIANLPGHKTAKAC